MYHRVLLHVEQKELIHGTFKKFPQHTDRHGETECHDRHIDRRQRQRFSLVTVQHIYQAESDRGTQKAIECVEHRVPVRKDRVVGTDLTEYLRRKNKQHDNDFHRVREIDLKLPFQDRRHQK